MNKPKKYFLICIVPAITIGVLSTLFCINLFILKWYLMGGFLLILPIALCAFLIVIMFERLKPENQVVAGSPISWKEEGITEAFPDWSDEMIQRNFPAPYFKSDDGLIRKDLSHPTWAALSEEDKQRIKDVHPFQKEAE